MKGFGGRQSTFRCRRQPVCESELVREEEEGHTSPGPGFSIPELEL